MREAVDRGESTRAMNRTRREFLHTVIHRSAGAASTGLLGAAGCRRSAAREVVAYVALDSEFSRPVLEAFTRETGIVVRAVYDVESTKTVGLANRLIAERSRPRCDLFWNNEVLHTVRLKWSGVLRSFEPSGIDSIPESFRDRQRMWYGFAARARVLIVNEDRLPQGKDRPDSIASLTDRAWQGKGSLARPLFGTTATHAAVLFDRWGAERAVSFFRQVKERSVVFPGNRQVAEAAARGEVLFGLTDTDDAAVQRDKGYPVAVVFPDQSPDGKGTLLIPNTVALVKGGPNPKHAERLAEYLLSAGVERQLASGRSAQIPVRPELGAVHPMIPERFHVMDADFEGAARVWGTAMKELKRVFS